MILGIQKYIIIGLVVALGISGYMWNRAEKAKTEARVALGVSEQNHTITKESFERYRENVDKSHKQMQASIDTLSKVNEESRRYKNELEQKLARHDFAFLAYKKPGLVTTAINNGTRSVFDSIEAATTSTAGAGL